MATAAAVAPISAAVAPTREPAPASASPRWPDSITSTPTKPAATAAVRASRTSSPSTTAASGTTASGVTKVKAVASASGRSASARKFPNMPPEPASDRPIWPNGRVVRSADGHSPREASHAASVAMAKTDRKNTISATG